MGDRRRRFLESLPRARRRPAVAYALAIPIVLAGFLVRWVADPVLPPGYPYLTFFPVVMLTAFLFGRGPGILSALLCGFIAWYVFIPPRFALVLDGGVALSLSFFAVVVAVDIAFIHWMQSANRRLVIERERSTMLADRSELLFRELQHRVSNNLQVVAALLSLHRRHVEDEQARDALDQASRRLALIGRIQRQLHDPSGALLAMTPFMEKLANDLIDAAGKRGIRSSVDCQPDIMLPPDAVVSLALVVAEAVSNAIEHGFVDRDEGHIEIGVRRVDDEIVVEVANDGHPLPERFDPTSADNLGLRIASTLARQLRGRFEMVGGQRTTARLVLPA